MEFTAVQTPAEEVGHVALFWVFINVHHYLLDTVMWRKGNPDVKRHLFMPVSA